MNEHMHLQSLRETCQSGGASPTGAATSPPSICPSEVTPHPNRRSAHTLQCIIQLSHWCKLEYIGIIPPPPLQESTGLILTRGAPSTPSRSTATWKREKPASAPSHQASRARTGGPARARTANTSGSARRWTEDSTWVTRGLFLSLLLQSLDINGSIVPTCCST